MDQRVSNRKIPFLPVIAVLRNVFIELVVLAKLVHRLALSHGLLTQSGVHGHHHVVRYLPHEDASVPAGRYQSATVVGEAQARGQFGMAAHRGHALARVVVVDGERLVGARGRHVDAATVQGYLKV